MLIVIVAESFDCKASGSDNRRMVGCGSFSEIMQVADTIVIASFIFFFISIPAVAVALFYAGAAIWRRLSGT